MAHSNKSATTVPTTLAYSHPTTSHPSHGQPGSPWSAASASTQSPHSSRLSNVYAPRTLPPQQQTPSASTALSQNDHPKSSRAAETGEIPTTSALAQLLRLDEVLRDAEAYLTARDEYFGAWPSDAEKVEDLAKEG